MPSLKGSSVVIRLDAELLAPVKIAAVSDNVTLQKWLSDCVRAELNSRQAHALEIKPITPR